GRPFGMSEDKQEGSQLFSEFNSRDTSSLSRLIEVLFTGKISKGFIRSSVSSIVSTINLRFERYR
uniref:hypothetical protein n=1 Tax=Cerasicoccus maritimus TaxID=490089 RepID=UPI002852C4A2